MRDLLFAAKRQLRAGFLLCLLLAALLPGLARLVGEQTALRPCGLYCADTSAVAADLAAKLESDGFRLYDSREALIEDTSSGVLNCGAVLESGLPDRLDTDELAGAVTLYTSASTYLPQIPMLQIQARLFTASAPARTEKAAQKADADVSDAAIEAALDELYAQGKRFTFTVETVSGSAPADTGTAVGQRLAEAACALMLFTALLPAIRREVRNARRMASRTGRRNAITQQLLPSLFWILLAGALAGLAAGMAAAGLAAYLLCLLGWGIVYALLPERAAGTVLTFWVIGSLALTPIWADLAELFPAAAFLRPLFPASLFPEMLQAPAVFAAIFIILMLAAIVPAVLRRYRHACV